MKRKQITLHGNQALSARNVSITVQHSGKYKSMIWIDEGTHHVNAKSMMGILSLKLMGGSTFELVASGPDEAEAIDELVKFLQQLPE